MDNVTLTIDGKKVTAIKDMTILEAALGSGIYIPHLCYHPDLAPFGACRLCIIQIEGTRGLPTACTTPVEDGLVVYTDSPKIQRIRQVAIELLISSHPDECLLCSKNLRCELQAMAVYLGVHKQRFRKTTKIYPVDIRSPLIERDPNKCILCGRCVRVCQDVRGVEAISFLNRGNETAIGSAFDSPLTEADCRFCGACVEVCPTGALSDTDLNWKTRSEREISLLPCMHACPAGVDIPRYVHLIAEGQYSEAICVIREKVPFPAVLGRVCMHPCEDACRREQLNEPIAIRNLKRFAADRDNDLWKQKLKIKPSTGKKVAIIGSGPAGLTSAYFLNTLGHTVDVYEELKKPGGMMRVGIPEFRLSRDVLDAEIEDIMKLGVTIYLNTQITSLDSLFEQGYDAIFIATGAHQNVNIGVEGEKCRGIKDCISFLRDIHFDKKVSLGKRVAVIGGGNAAIDAARTAVRFTDNVTVLYRRTRKEMPATSEEIDEAILEGVNFMFLVVPQKMSHKDGVVKLDCIRCRLGDPDRSGRCCSVPIKGSEFTLEFDTVIPAIGQIPKIPKKFGLTTGKGNTLLVDPETLETNVKGVFAGGDVVSGPTSIIEAIASGRKAATNIDRFLGGTGVIDQPLVYFKDDDPYIGRIEKFNYLHREKTNTLSMESRKNNFDEVDLGFNEKEAIKEAIRCLRCSLRLQISKVKRPPIDVTA